MLFLTGCSSAAPTRELVVPEVPADLRAPCLVAPREAVSLTDVAIILTDYAEGLDCANGRIAAIDGILTAAEASGLPK